ncbi:MAG TPA: hypothetical protein VH475_00585, partial [Tepidisphaeraceae bacterium]
MAVTNKAAETKQERIGNGEQKLSLAVEIRSPDFNLTSVLRSYAMEHLAAKLLKHARRIQSVIVRFEDRKAAR